MTDPQHDWRRAIEQTFVVRPPKQHLATFGVTNIKYYVVTEPIYQEIDPNKREGVVRTGRVVAERPAIVTPNYFMNLQGFSDEAYEFFRDLARMSGPNSPGILYQYKNEPGGMEIVGGIPSEIAHRISKGLDEKNDDMSVVMCGVDELWDVSLLKFIYEFTASSAGSNVREMKSRGLFDPEPRLGGVPRAAAQQVERLFAEAERGGSVDHLKEELDRWGVFDYYEDRFLNLFRRR